MKDTKPIQLRIKIDFSDKGDAPPLHAYAFTRQGKLLASAPVEGALAVIDTPAELDGRSLEIILGPPVEPGQPVPSASAFKRMGAYAKTMRFFKEKPHLELAVPSIFFPHWCLCLVRGKLVKRVRLPDGSMAEQPVCNTRVHICEVDRIKFVIERLPEIDIWRLRDDLLDKLVIAEPFPPPRDPFPGPGPGPGPFPGPFPGPGPDPAPFSNLPKMRSKTSFLSMGGIDNIHLHALATSKNILSLRHQLIQVSDLILVYLCDLHYLWPFFDLDCMTTIEANSDGRFNTLIGYDCNDQPDLYFWVEQLQNGVWQTVYRPGIGCGTHWNYACGSEIVLNLPGAEACEEPTVELPPGVTLFVLPYAIGNTPIWGTPSGDPAPAAPNGWVRSDGLTNYHSGSSLGWLYNAPFGATLNFIQDDSYFIPSAGIKYYRYSYRRVGGSDWTPITTPLSRTYRMEYSDQLPTYQGYEVGPKTVNGKSGLFEFKPQTPPVLSTDIATVVAREWVSGNLSEVAASWDTIQAVPPLSSSNVIDRAGNFEIQIEVFDPDGNQVFPGAATFRFLLRNADGTTTRLATAGEEVTGAYVFRVHVDNNGVNSALPQPSIDDVAATDDCGFLMYEPGDQIHLQYLAAHPNNRAVFGFGVKRGSNPLAVATTTGDYVEVSAISAPTSSTAYVKSGGNYQHDFPVLDLVGTCVNAAFAASLNVYGKATNGYHRLGYDASELVAFALAEQLP